MGTLTLSASVGQCNFQITSNLNMSQQGKAFKQRYYLNIYTLNLCRPGLYSGKAHSEHVATAEKFQTAILS